MSNKKSQERDEMEVAARTDGTAESSSCNVSEGAVNPALSYCEECGAPLELNDIHAGLKRCFWCEPPWGTEG